MIFIGENALDKESSAASTRSVRHVCARGHRRLHAAGALKTRDWKMEESEKYGKRRFQKCVSDCTD